MKAKAYSLIILIFVTFYFTSCKKETICPCGANFKKQAFDRVFLPVPIPNSEFYIIQNDSCFNYVFQHYILDGIELPSIDFSNKTLLGCYEDYSDSNYDYELFLCKNSKKKEFAYKIFLRKSDQKMFMFPTTYWILVDKISPDFKISIEKIKK